MQIKKAIEKVPGGMIVVPLLLGALVHTFFPNGAEYLGGFTGQFMGGTGVILFIFFFALGTGLDLRSTPRIARKGMTILLVKVLLAAGLGIFASRFLPVSGVQSGLFAGLSVLAIITTFNAVNGGLFVALMTPLNRKIDAASYPFFSIQSGPFFTMLTLGAAGLGSFPWQALVSTLIPYILGVTLGSLDKEIRKMFAPVAGALVPFFAFTLGNTLDLAMIARSGFTGILMGVGVVVITGAVMWVADKYIAGSDGLAGIASSSTAGAAVTVPATIAMMDKSYAATASSATAIVATSVIVTALLTPLATMWYYKYLVRHNALEDQTVEPAERERVDELDNEVVAELG